MLTLKEIREKFACGEEMAQRIADVQAAGQRHGKAGWYPDGDFSSDADWCYGAGAEIQAICDRLDVDDNSVFDVYYEAWSEASPPRPERYEVDFTLQTYPSDVSIRGNVLASGDDAEDRAAEQDVTRRVADGDAWAWFDAVVTAEYEGVTATAALGACSYTDEASFRSAEWESLCDEAHEALLTLLHERHVNAKGDES